MDNHRAELDGVRGFACLSVLVLHIIIGPIRVAPDSFFAQARTVIQPFLIGGVDLFFVLSGFLISGILMDAKGTPARDFFPTFWRRRIGRIFPVYYLMVGLVPVFYGLHAIFNAKYTSYFIDTVPFWTYATFTQNFYFIATGNYGNFLGVTWSLAMEEQFYLLLPFAIYFLSKRRIAQVAICLIILAPFVRTVLWELINWRASYHLTPGRMDTIMWGVLIAYVVRRPDIMTALSHRTLLIDAMMIGLILIVAFDVTTLVGQSVIGQHRSVGLFAITLRYSALAMLYGLLLLRLSLPGGRRLKSSFSTTWLAKVGLVSYAAYMYHQLIHFALYRAVYDTNPLLDRLDKAWMPVAVFALTFLAAAVSYRYMEKPIQRWARKSEYKRTSPAQAAGNQQAATVA
ncbi:acyltransferase [Bosea sp. BK604]|uniref:acyltransferase family protein n=1 Tax=Bosea sp. BK604 TaxID=2512180 RepID=UPI0010518246|nr:acyltransferase [Bosea sp. BK604]TCR68834.1 peptidoglycan/LPS O-acetylase OafA/YrhL [Bosea sp. BK604]